MYDTIYTWMRCPYCGHTGMFEAQTKDLDKVLFGYRTLDKEWNTSKLGKKFRNDMPVTIAFPKDKENKVWKSQAERTEAQATVPKEYQKLKYVLVTASCSSIICQFDADRRDILVQGTPSGFGRCFEGKIKIENGKLIGPIYDIEKDGLKESNLAKYKVKHKKKFDKLMKRYKHEPIVCREWGRFE